MQPSGITALGLVFLCVTWTALIVLNVWCMAKVLFPKRRAEK